MSTGFPCKVCGRTAPPVEVAERWSVWLLAAAISQKPYGRAHLPLAKEAAGTCYLVCDRCLVLLMAGRTAELARLWAAAQGPIPRRVYDAALKETALFLTKLADNGAPIPVSDFLAATPALYGGE